MQVAEFQALQSVYSEPGAVEEDSEGLLQQVQQVHARPASPSCGRLVVVYRLFNCQGNKRSRGRLPPVPCVHCIFRFGPVNSTHGSAMYLRATVQALECEPGIGNVAPQLSGRVRLTDVAAPGSEPLSLHFSLPRGYPSSAVPVLRVHFPPSTGSDLARTAQSWAEVSRPCQLYEPFDAPSAHGCLLFSDLT